ncbi:pyrimidine reductase family protein [Arthrobacter sp. LAPM80]|uniref:pyrimidine reductase family protein n=1 Tax=Arthrobacter sp. LAPM80 TaxID=3141788 RepID=UPI00398ABC72
MMERLFPNPALLSATALEQEVLAPPPENSRTGRPWVGFNFISSIDGAASMDGLSGQLGNAWDLRVFSLLRQNADVILVGAQTIRAEGYGGELLSKAAQQWRHDHWMQPHPPLAIVSGSLNLYPDLEVFRQAPHRPLILTLESAPQERRDKLSKVAELVMVGGESLEPELVISELARRGLPNIHCEGGPTLLGTFAAAGLVDELNLTISPLLVGGSAGRIANSPNTGADASAPDAPAGMSLVRILKADSMLFLRYVRGTD